MAASEHTSHYSLSQFGPGDRPSWIDDYNSDMRAIDEAIGDGNQAVTDITNEISDIKNKLDATSLIFNYFTYNEEESFSIRASNGSADFIIGSGGGDEGLGDNGKISLPAPRMMQVHEDGLYVIWSTIGITRFGSNMPDTPITASFSIYQEGNFSTVYANTVTPLTTDSEYPERRIEQSIIFPPTAIRLGNGAYVSIGISTPSLGGIYSEHKAWQKASATGIVKIR